MPKDVFLHPDFVQDVVEELLSSDIIGKEKIALLKNDSYKKVDPNLIMEIRHKEVKKESLIDFIGDKVKSSETRKRETLKSCLKPVTKMKDLKTIDKEIATTKKTLLAFHYELEKRHESFVKNIVNLEVEEREQSITTPLIVNLNEEEAKQYFNLHLEHLEEREVPSLSRQQTNVWKPFEIKPSSVINVITNFKDFDEKPSPIQYDKEELEILTMLKMDSIHITGKTLLNLSTEQDGLQEEVNNTVPSNTPSLYPYECCFIKEIVMTETIHRTDEIAQDVIKRWKRYSTKNRMRKLEEESMKKLNFELSKKVFNKWRLFVNQSKAKKEEDILINKYLRQSKKDSLVRCKNKKKSIEFGKRTPRKCLELQKKNLDQCLDLFTYDICCPKKIRSDTALLVNNDQKNCDAKNIQLAGSSKVSSTLQEEGKINIKIFKPEEVGLMKNENSDQRKDYGAVNDIKAHKSNLAMTKTEKSKKHQEPLNNRFAAQEKIIAQQLEVIEEQKKLIFDLHAQNLQVQSKLSLQVAESELAKASCNKKLKPITRAPETRLVSNMLKIDEKSDQLCKNMLERQKYCKMLAERTKLRKMRIEEEKAKLKLELEEKERQEKEEEKRQRLLKMKMEQQLTKEKAQKDLSYKRKIAELSKRATDHYSQHLMNKTFKAFKQISCETYIKSKECTKIYERNSLRRVFVSWRSEVNKSIASKCEMAEKVYCTKLMERFWNTWRRDYQEFRIKVQVSEDMFVLKLQERMLRRWTAFASKQYLQTCYKVELADRLQRKQMLRHVFRHWRELPKLMFAERERDQRRRAWRQAVKELIPDFTPVFAEKLEV